MKRIAIDVDDGLHRAIRAGAASRGHVVTQELREVLAVLYSRSDTTAKKLDISLSKEVIETCAAAVRASIDRRSNSGATDPITAAHALRRLRLALQELENALAEPLPTNKDEGLNYAAKKILSFGLTESAPVDTNSPTADEIEHGLTDPNASVRADWAQSYAFEPTDDQIERGLCDTCERVRAYWAQRVDIDFTEGQIERGLADSSSIVRYVFRSKRPAGDDR
jgi:plasmid stability protein